MFDEFYGLTAKPFQLTPDPAFYYPSGTHQKALSYLRYGLAQGEGFIVITGEVGAGKSTLVAHLMASIDPGQLTVGQVVTSKLDGQEIVHVVARSFGLDIEGHDKASALSAIEGFLHDEARNGRRCLLVVDESQNLSVAALEELRMLSNFQLGSHPLMQTLLLGQPEFRDMLNTYSGLEQLRQRVIAAHHLGPMEAEEIGPYILHRLKQVGWRGNPDFDPAVFVKLFEASGGIPRRINQIANRLLLMGAIERSNRIDVSMLDSVLEDMEADAPTPEKTASVPREERRKMRVDRRKAQSEQDSETDHGAGSGLDQAAMEEAMATRDAQIAELQQAVVELSQSLRPNGQQPEAQDASGLQQRIEELEERLADQERTMRHTLTMLIEWIENEDGSQKAA